MVEYTQISINPGEVGDEVYRRICSIYPEARMRHKVWRGQMSDYFQFNSPSDDQRVLAVIAALAEAGFQPWSDHTREIRADEYMLDLIRKYDREDYEAAEYLIPSPKIYVEGRRMTEGGPIRITKKTVRPGVLLATAGGFDKVVSSGFLEAIKAASLRHIASRPTQLYDSEAVVDGKWSPHIEPWPQPAEALLELASDFILPPFAPSVRLEYEDGTPFDGHFERGCMIMEGLYREPELHYLASSLHGLEPFDLACSFEWFDTKWDRYLVASKRFYQFCVEQGVETEWVPVRIDPG